MKIAVYSGSFNPLHIGHRAIMEYLTSHMDFDMVYLIVSPKNPLKGEISADSGPARFRAAVEAVDRCGLDKVKVDDIELRMPSPQYTVKTLEALRKREPGNSFTLIMGADQLADIRRWREYRTILTEFGVAVYPRKGFDLQEIKEDLMRECSGYMESRCTGMWYRIQLMDAPMVDISSTELRNAIMAGIDVSAYLM
ncbi:MAG: nicotinate (nicotinamide) nucleotide adenylyltransferase [Clostridium sp.]|nr:nicotinate (nicotinamide) nucleotide adenylyltransferase [Bacteroides sp.]MCM1198533.1 nicotinate (nicotinamide) nucleotide adenylyltransferase [Clostridium sp.]